tara:strand:+ start:2122 stop:2343 length:222 start_codon:yes stop_codon:yes gene_type:complete
MYYAYLILGQRMLKDSQKMVRTSVILPEDKRDHLERLAKENGFSVALVIRCAIDEFIENTKNNKKLKIKSVKE